MANQRVNQPVCSRGEWAVKRERLHLADTRRPTTDHLVQPAEALEHIFKTPELKDMLWMQNLTDHWVDIAGEQVARQARPGHLRNGRLTVFVRSPVWMNELMRFGKQKLLDNLQQHFGKARIADLRFAADPDAHPSSNRPDA